MKFFFFILLILGCEKVGYRPVPQSPAPSREVSKLEADFSAYEENIDVMVAFLWPRSITTQAQRDSMRTVISSSRELQKSKNRYFSKKLVLQKRFQDEACNCHLNSLCEEGQEPGEQESCLKIEEETYANDRDLIPIMELVELVKSEVLKCGGEWLETQSDLTDLAPSRFDFKNKTLHLSALGSQDQKPMEYEVTEMSFSSEELYRRLEMSFPRKHLSFENFGHFNLDLGVKASSASLTFQGDLFWDYQGVRRQGIVYWEHMHR